MKKYTLEAKLNTNENEDLNFLLEDNPSLIEIDQYTNVYSEREFFKILQSYFESSITDLISGFQIAICGKNYSYSVVFQNKYLEGVLENLKQVQNKKEYQIPTDCPAFLEMKKFLMSDLEQGGKKFLKYYQYKNRLSRFVGKYLNGCFDTEESLHEKRRIEEEIFKEIRKYKTYRSLCIYRKSLEKKLNVPIQKTSPIKNLKPTTEKFTKSYSIDRDNSCVAVKYQPIWENANGEEREEFLETDEIEEMVKIHGK